MKRAPTGCGSNLTHLLRLKRLVRKNTPAYIATLNWSALEYNGIVDAYCDQAADEYVVYTV